MTYKMIYNMKYDFLDVSNYVEFYGKNNASSSGKLHI